MIWAEDKVDVLQAYRTEKRTREKNARTSSIEFESVDKLYFSKEVQLDSCIKELFHEELEVLDFANEVDKSLATINNFVSNVTRGNIPDLLTAGDVSPATKVVLANAAYFKGNWASKFDAKFTKKEIFYTSSEKMSFVQMMNKNASYNHGMHKFHISWNN